MNSEESKEQKILQEINNLKEELKSNEASDIIEKLRKEISLLITDNKYLENELQRKTDENKEKIDIMKDMYRHLENMKEMLEIENRELQKYSEEPLRTAVGISPFIMEEIEMHKQQTK